MGPSPQNHHLLGLGGPQRQPVTKAPGEAGPSGLPYGQCCQKCHRGF